MFRKFFKKALDQTFQDAHWYTKTIGYIPGGIIEEAKKMSVGKIEKREMSDSITHLVKIVAAEVCEGFMKIHFEKAHMNPAPDLEQMGNDFCENIQSSMEKAGRPWSGDEDSLLVQEMKTAVAQAAVNHKRSRGSIKARIQDKKFFTDY
jgi:hypothetical protein